MKKLCCLGLLLNLIVLGACSTGPTKLTTTAARTASPSVTHSPTPRLCPPRHDVGSALLTIKDVPEGWSDFRPKGGSSGALKVGGTLGSGDIKEPFTSAKYVYYEQTGDLLSRGQVSESVRVMATIADARRVVTVDFPTAAKTTQWTYRFSDGFIGHNEIHQLHAPDAGEDEFSIRIAEHVTGPNGATEDHTGDYVVFSVANLVAIVLVNDATLQTSGLVTKAATRLQAAYLAC